MYHLARCPFLKSDEPDESSTFTCLALPQLNVSYPHSQIESQALVFSAESSLFCDLIAKREGVPVNYSVVGRFKIETDANMYV